MATSTRQRLFLRKRAERKRAERKRARSLSWATAVLLTTPGCGNEIRSPSESGADDVASSGSSEITGSSGIDTGTDTGGENTDIIEPQGTSVLLHVVGGAGLGIAKAVVTVEGHQHITDGGGYLLLEQLTEERLVARVDAPDHTSSVVAIELSEDLHAFKRVELLPLGPALDLDADQGGSVERDGVRVDIPPGALVNEFGEPVYGLAQVTISSFDPTTDRLAQMPAPLEGRTLDNQSVGLITVAMAEISLWQGGKPLQLAPGKSATLELLLPAEYAAQQQPGDEILGWSLNLDSGSWAQEQSGVVQPSLAHPGVLAWTSQVNHFTWYNIDRRLNWSDFKCYAVSFVDSEGHIVPFQHFTTFISNAVVPSSAGELGTFADAGFSAPIETNIISNCVLAVKDSLPQLSVDAMPDYLQQLPAGNEDSGVCLENGLPNPQCTPVQFSLPDLVICTPGSYVDCGYTGAPGTRGVGICQGARNFCIDDGTAWSGCQGEITPAETENCYTPYDDDCNYSTTNWDPGTCDCVDGETAPCYTGTYGTEGTGICTPGQRSCVGGKFGPICTGQMTPLDEGCETYDVDEDCDGINDCVPPAPPVLSLNISAVKRFEFSWSDVAGAQHYQLLEKRATDPDYLPISGDILDTQFTATLALYTHKDASFRLRACNYWGCSESGGVTVAGSLADAVGYVKSSNTDAGDYFGYSLALSADGDTLAVGAIREDGAGTSLGADDTDNTAPEAGAVYVYSRDPLTQLWEPQPVYIKASNTRSDDGFGQSLALSDDGNTLAVGASGEDGQAANVDGDAFDFDGVGQTGAVYVYERDPMTMQWSAPTYVKASNPSGFDYFGCSVALSGDGDTLAVGAYGEDGGATGVGGAQYDSAQQDSGAVYVYVRDPMTQEWQGMPTYIKASNTGGGDYFGWSVALTTTGDTLAVGAQHESSCAVGIDGNADDDTCMAAGAVYVYQRDPMTTLWGNDPTYVKASNTGASDRFGGRVSLSGSGNTLAVGAYWEDGSATGIGGADDDAANESGAVYVYERNPNTMMWSLPLYIKAPNTEADDYFGISLDLSREGNTLVVGAWYEDGNAVGIGGDLANDAALNSGAAYVYMRDPVTTQWLAEPVYVKASNISSNFGISVALASDEGALAVGAWWENSYAIGIGGDQANNFAPGSGAAYLY